MFRSLLCVNFILQVNFQYLAFGFRSDAAKNTSFSTRLRAPEIQTNWTNDWLAAGGEVADVSFFPYMVGIQSTSSYCSGTYIQAPAYVLSAAHCFLKSVKAPAFVEPDEIHLFFGTNRFSGGVIASVKYISPHPDFLKSEVKNSPYDLIVLKSAREISDNVRIKPIQIPGIDFSIEGMINNEDECTFTGYGMSYLNSVNLKLLPMSKCLERFKDWGFILEEMTQLCTFTEGKVPCPGDDGGPLVCGKKFVGVFSFPKDCDTNSPAVFVRVDTYRSWITTQLAMRRSKSDAAHSPVPSSLVLIPGVMLFLEIVSLITAGNCLIELEYA